jgi:1-acyl-sn-glycerol-3-phosphate acyltransferase
MRGKRFTVENHDDVCNNLIWDQPPLQASNNAEVLGDREGPANTMNTLLKIAETFLFLIAYILTSCFISIFPASGKLRRSMRIQVTSFFSGLGLALFGIRVHVDHGEQLHRSRGGRLFVSNHLSDLDVLIISSLAPSIFITSVELKHTFLLGTLARSSGCLFVERRKFSGLKQEIEDITRALDQGFSVVLFPEGTTSNGDCVHPFKNSLFDAAVSAGSDILPCCLRYTKINGEPVNTRNRDDVFYYGGTTFFSHLLRLVAQKSVNVEVIPLKTIAATSGISRKELAAQAHDAICAAYQARQGPKSVMLTQL